MLEMGSYSSNQEGILPLRHNLRASFEWWFVGFEEYICIWAEKKQTLGSNPKLSDLALTVTTITTVYLAICLTCGQTKIPSFIGLGNGKLFG